jgi:putative ABC transport system substrate-binding protein
MLSLMLLCGSLLTSAHAAAQRDTSKSQATYRIGFHLWKPGGIYDEAMAGIRDGLDLAGITYETVTMHADRTAAKAIENFRRLDKMGLDLIYSLPSAGTKIAYKLAMQTPVIATVVNHPASLGLETDKRTASNIRLTGTSYYIDTQAQLELYLTLFPQARKIGMVYDQHNPAGYLAEEPFMRKASQAQNLAFVSVGIEKKAQLAAATRELIEQHVDIIVIPTNHLVYSNLTDVLDITEAQQIPVVAMNKQGVENGALAALFGDTYKLGRYTAPIAQQILLNKTEPGAIPFQFTPKPDLILNLRAAHQLGFEFPVDVLGDAAIILQ